MAKHKINLNPALNGSLADPFDKGLFPALQIIVLIKDAGNQNIAVLLSLCQFQQYIQNHFPHINFCHVPFSHQSRLLFPPNKSTSRKSCKMADAAAAT